MHKWPTSRALLPLIVKFGVATAEEVGIETLADRLILQKSIQSVMAASILPVIVVIETF